MSAPAPTSSSTQQDKDDAASSAKLDLKSLPPVKLAIRSKPGVEFRSAPFSEFTPTTGAGLRTEAGAEGQILYSHDGSVLALVSPKEVKLLDTANNNAQISLLPRPRIEHLWFSPGHSYLATWDRKTNDNKQQENLIVWNVRTGEEMFKVHCQDLDPTAQRPVQWTWDEAFMAYIVTNEVKFYPAAAPNLAAPSSRLHIQTIAQFALAPGQPSIAGAAPAAVSSPSSSSRQQYHIAAFLPVAATSPHESVSIRCLHLRVQQRMLRQSRANHSSRRRKCR